MTEYLNIFNLSGKKAIVTGGTRGLCYSMAEGLHKAGAEVVLIGSSGHVFASAEKMATEGVKVYAVRGDLSIQENVPGIYAEALRLLGGRVDLLVNGAGMQHRCKAEEFPLEQWNKIINLNLNAVFLMAQLAGKTMLKQGAGKIINVASLTSFFGSEMIPAYTASKGAVAQLTKALSNEWSGRGVTVNAIAPGYMISELTADMKEKNPRQYEEVTGRIPMHRWGTPEDLQGITVFLASQASNYITGAVIPVDGGYLGK